MEKTQQPQQNNNQWAKKKSSIRIKMLGTILPVMIAAMVLIDAVCAYRSYDLVEKQLTVSMNSQLESNSNMIQSELDIVRTTTRSLARTVEASYRYTSMDQYQMNMENLLKDNDIIRGVGIWFAPNVYQAGTEYMGPYWCKNGNDVSLTYDYSNADYDYFTQGYYVAGIALKPGETDVTDPFFDGPSGVFMASCVAPIYDMKTNTCIGCVTADISLDSIDSIVKDIKVGYGGTASLLDSSGVYLYDVDSSKVKNSMNVKDDKKGIASVSSTILNKESGVSQAQISGEKYNIYYKTIPGVNWKLIMKVPQKEMFASIIELIKLMLLIGAVASIICLIVILRQVNNISKSLDKVKVFAGNLAQGNFQIEKIQSKTNDELGEMSGSLNEMFDSNRNVISEISKSSTEVTSTSETISQVAAELNDRFEMIQDNMAQVNEAMTSTGAATEEVSASVSVVNESVTYLATEVTRTNDEVVNIKKRAVDIEKNSQKAYDNAISIVEQRGEELGVAREKAEIVGEIGNLASSIADIADQINLLSLNASIEAARAGEQGKGFAVVAAEINKLAGETAAAVDQIQTTITGVQGAFKTLNDSASEMLEFLENTVTPDYNNFVGIGQQYGKDASVFGDLFDQIQVMVGDINQTMAQVNSAIQNIAESAQNTANSSSEITETINEVSGTVENVTTMSNNQEKIAESLGNIVGKFKL